MKNTLNKKGISLIVLVITIVVMIILAGAVILTLVNSGIIGQTKMGIFKNDVSSYKAELTAYIANEMLTNENFKVEEFSRDSALIKSCITSMSDVDAERFLIIQGKLIYIVDDELFTAEEMKALNDIGIRPNIYNYEANLSEILSATDYTGQTIYINPNPIKPSQDFGYRLASSSALFYSPEEMGEAIAFINGDGKMYQYIGSGQIELREELVGININGKVVEASGPENITFKYSGWVKVEMSADGETVENIFLVLPENLPKVICDGTIGDTASTIIGIQNYVSFNPYVVAQ